MVHNTARPYLGTHTFPFLPILFRFLLHRSLTMAWSSILSKDKTYQGGKQHRRVAEYLDDLLDDHFACFQDPHAAPPWSRHAK